MKKLTILWQASVIGLLCFSLIASQGCTLAQKQTAVTDIEKFLPAVTNVAEAICAFTPAAIICTGAVVAVTGSAKVLVTALQSYYAAEAAGTVPPSILQDLATAIATFENDATNILDAVHVVDSAHQAEVIALAAAAQVLLGFAESLFPSAAVSTPKFAHPKTFSLNHWVVDYNNKVSDCQKYVPRSVNLKKVHIHNVVLRVMTVGILK